MKRLILVILALAALTYVVHRNQETVKFYYVSKIENIQESKKELYKFHNQIRIKKGLPKFKVSKKLSAAAQGHSDWMAKHRKMSHSEYLSGLQSRVEKESYHWKAIGENIAAGQTSVEEVMSAWMSSPGHRANILGRYQEIGIGIAVSADNTIYWTVDFGTKNSQNY